LIRGGAQRFRPAPQEVDFGDKFGAGKRGKAFGEKGFRKKREKASLYLWRQSRKGD